MSFIRISKMRLKRSVIAATLSLAALLMSNNVSASADQAAIRKTLEDWTQAFNSGNAEVICNLFAPTLRYDYRGFPERGFDDICSLLKRSLSERSRRFAYSLDIKEIIVSDELAIVRLVWTLKITENGSEIQTQEPGMDIFQRQPNGDWKIIRYMAYED